MAVKQEFKNLTEVAAFLKEQGWKVAQRTVYRHGKEGKILSDPSGIYLLKAVQKYARLHLMMTDTRKKIRDDELQRNKTAAEVDKTQEQAKLARFKREILEGKYMPREEVNLELAARAGVLQDGLRYRNRTLASDLIQAVGGDQERVADLIRALDDSDRELLNQYASMKEFEVVFEGAVQE